MKHHISLFILAFVLFGCNQPEEETCPAPDFEAAQAGSGGGIQIYDMTGNSELYGFFEVQYGPNGFSFGSGTTQNINDNGTISGLAGGTYDVYLRGNCGGTDWSDWAGPISLLIQGGNSSSCDQPTNLRQYWSDWNFNLLWDDVSDASYYELEYGPSGFSLGSGTVETVNNSSFSDGVFSAGTTYDYYVRSNCGGGEWSDWLGPESFFADKNANRCLKPLSFTAERNGGYIEIDIVPDGENQHEVNFNNSNFIDSQDIHTQNQTNGTYGTFYTNVTYYAWVRSVCNDGSKTAWTGPVIIY